MAARIALEFIFGILLSLALYIFALVHFHNSVVSAIMNSGLVISKLDYQVADVIAWVIIGSIMLVLIGAALYAYNEIVYRTGG